MIENNKILEKLELAKKIVDKTDNEALKEELKEIKNKDGTAYDNEMAIDMNNIASNYDNVSSNTISQYCTKSIYLSEDQLQEIEKDKSLLQQILEFLFGIEFHNNVKKNQSLTLENNFNKAILEPNKPVQINNSDVQIISILEDKHFTACILDKKNKSLILFDPNGSILDQSKFQGCKTKQDIFERVFGKEQAQELMKNGFKVYDSNRHTFCSNKMNDKDIFDGITITNEQKNGSQTKNGACGHICKMMIESYLQERSKHQNGKISNLKNTIDDINYNLDTSYENIVDRKITDALNRFAGKSVCKIDSSFFNKTNKCIFNDIPNFNKTNQQNNHSV